MTASRERSQKTHAVPWQSTWRLGRPAVLSQTLLDVKWVKSKYCYHTHKKDQVLEREISSFLCHFFCRNCKAWSPPFFNSSLKIKRAFPLIIKAIPLKAKPLSWKVLKRVELICQDIGSSMWSQRHPGLHKTKAASHQRYTYNHIPVSGQSNRVKLWISEWINTRPKMEQVIF